MNKIHGASCQQRAHMQRLVRGLRKQIGSELSVLAHFAWLVQKTDRPNTKHARWTQKRQWLILVTLREAPSEHLFARICWRVCRGASAKQSRVPGAGKIARLGAGWVVGGRGTARNCAENALPLHTKASQSKEACAKQQFENTLEKATWNSHFPVLFFDRKGWKIGAKMYMERAQKSRTSPEERDYTFCNYCIDFWLKQPSVQPFFGLIFSVAFEDVLQQKVPKMLCYYPRKHSRAKKHTQNVNLKRSLKEQPENAIS